MLWLVLWICFCVPDRAARRAAEIVVDAVGDVDVTQSCIALPTYSDTATRLRGVVGQNFAARPDRSRIRPVEYPATSQLPNPGPCDEASNADLIHALRISGAAAPGGAVRIRMGFQAKQRPAACMATLRNATEPRAAEPREAI